MGKKCWTKYKECIARCAADNEGPECYADCSTDLVKCLREDWIGMTTEDISEVASMATMLETWAKEAMVTVSVLRSKVDAMVAASSTIRHSDGRVEPFQPNGLLFPSLLRTGIDYSTARALTDGLTTNAPPSRGVSELRSAVLRELERVSPPAATTY